MNQDEIRIIALNEYDHLQTLSLIFSRLEQYGLKVNAKKMCALKTLCMLAIRKDLISLIYNCVIRTLMRRVVT